MKSILPIAAVLLAVLNSLLLIPALNAYTFAIAVVALVLAVLVALLSFSGIRRRAAVAPSEPVAAKPPPPAANQADAEIVALWVCFRTRDGWSISSWKTSTLRRHTGWAAARVVHQGCRAVLNEHLKISPSDAEEGSQIRAGGLRPMTATGRLANPPVGAPVAQGCDRKAPGSPTQTRTVFPHCAAQVEVK
jgi:hypothetical protein